MQQLVSVWNALDARKRVIVSLASISVFIAVLALARVVGTPSMALLYSGLEPGVAGEVVGALEQQGVAYSVRGNAIYIDVTERDRMRMSLAEQGLPAAGSAGYEILDNLSRFGTTAQMFDVAYWRAKEGELARTILAWPQVKSARIHIASTSSRPFTKTPAPTASVTLELSAGSLSDSRARALRFLVASAVSGLSPENVSVIDSDRGLVLNGASGELGIFSTDRRAAALKANVERLLNARVGAGNAVVEVSVETVREQETIVERRFDPDSRVAISTDTEEVSGNASDSGGTPVTVASNLPDGEAASGDSS